MPSKVRKSNRIENDFKRIGTQDDGDDDDNLSAGGSSYSQASISRYYASKSSKMMGGPGSKVRREIGLELLSERSNQTAQPYSSFSKRKR